MISTKLIYKHYGFLKNMVHTRVQVTTYFKENIFAFFNAQNSLNVVDSAALITCSSKHNNEDDYA